jgi:hypothetical protein
MFNYTLCLVLLQRSQLPPMAGFIDPQAQLLPMSSCVWNLDTFRLSTTRNADQADQPCILHIPGMNGIIRTQKAAQTFISILHLPTFSSLRILSHQCKGPEKNFCQFRPGHDGIQEWTTRFTAIALVAIALESTTCACLGGTIPNWTSSVHKALPGFFLRIFSSLTCLKNLF